MLLRHDLTGMSFYILDNLDFHIWILNDEETYEYANETHCKFLGKDKLDVERKKLWDLLEDDVAYICYNNNRKVVEKGNTIISREWTNNYKGEKCLLEIKREPITDQKNKVKYIICKAFDITEQYNKEKRMKINEEQYKAIVENQNNLICRFLPDSTLTYVNKAYCSYFNKSFNELVGTKFLTLIPEKYHDEVKKKLSWLSVENPINVYEHQVVNSNGEICWQRWTDQAFFDGNGNIVEIQSVGVDITELKTKEKLLKETCQKIQFEIEENTKLLNRTKKDLIKEINERKAMQEILKENIIKLRQSLNSGIDVICKIIEMKDPYTNNHQIRVAYLAYNIAKEMGLKKSQLNSIYVAGILHDVGKIYVPSEILSKPGRLTDIEFNLIKIHSDIGYEILNKISFPWPIDKIILQHHERIDGSGYPKGLLRDEIMLEAKIIGVADVVEAMSSHRPYRPALGITIALEEIQRYKGIRYDKDVVEACTKLFLEKDFILENKKLDIAKMIEV